VRPSLPLLLAIVTAACRPDCTPAPGDARPHIVLVTVDTLRADHVGAYGSPRVRTPHLDRLAAEGALFLRTYAQTHLTVPAHLSLFSSRSLARHGVLSNAAVPPRPVEPLLPDLLARAGYRTAAFVSARHLGRGGPLGVPLGPSFEVYRATERWYEPLPGARTTRRFVRWLRKSCRAPVFAWIHYWDPHMPYAPPAPYDTAYYHEDPTDARHTSLVGRRFGWGLYDLGGLRPALAPDAAQVRSLKRELGLGTRAVSELVLRPVGIDGAGRGGPDVRSRLAALADRARARLALHPQMASWLAGVRDLGFARARYAGEVSYVDAQIGVVRHEIERLGLAARTVVVVTADHGESLGEHAVYFDHYGLHEQDLRVPLIVWAPGRIPPARRDDVVRTIDIAPTVLSLAGLPVPAAMDGRDVLAPHLPTVPAFAELEGRRQIAIVDGRWKLLRTLESFHYVEGFARERGAVELYDLLHDPAETRNVADLRPATVRALDLRLEAWNAAELARAPAPAAAAVDPAWRAKLRALGYVE
jgi:arylsulfatase A-like enzyme